MLCVVCDAMEDADTCSVTAPCPHPLNARCLEHVLNVAPHPIYLHVPNFRYRVR